MILARKYRPRFFREVLGQDVFVRVMCNALASNRVAHGFLLTGIRGVGKTTLARLMAKALTCSQRQEDQEACGVCNSCSAMEADKHLDVVEMDGASHTGVEDVRQILDSCMYRPVMGPYKIFIIDEVHMLSKHAFNAMLKTLEEPPAHIKFILATTEVQKVPLTVISRCQQMHLKRLSIPLLVEHLRHIGKKEGVESESSALEILASASEGSARDALSFLDRALVLAGPSSLITASLVRSLLGLPPPEEIEALMDAIVRQELDLVLKKARDFYEKGMEPQSILSALLPVIHRHVMEEFSQKSSSICQWDRWWQLAQQGLLEIGPSPFPLLALEMVLIRLTYVGSFPTPAEVLQSIESPEKFSVKDQELRARPMTASASPKTVSPSDLVQKIDFQADSTQESQSLDSLPELQEEPSFVQLLQVLKDRREGLLYSHMAEDVHFIRWQEQKIFLRWLSEKEDPRKCMAASIASSLEKFLLHWTGKAHRVIFQNDFSSNDSGDFSSWSGQQAQQMQVLHQKALDHSLMKKAKSLFPHMILEEVQIL